METPHRWNQLRPPSTPLYQPQMKLTLFEFLRSSQPHFVPGYVFLPAFQTQYFGYFVFQTLESKISNRQLLPGPARPLPPASFSPMLLLNMHIFLVLAFAIYSLIPLNATLTRLQRTSFGVVPPSSRSRDINTKCAPAWLPAS